MSDIVERLRQGVDPDDIQETEAAMDKGADEIARLRTANEYAFGPAGELAKCRAETERLNKAVAELDDVATAHDRVVRKNERLKAALREMLHAIGHDRKELVDGAADRARAALEGK